jgi:3-oxoacyl-[acyl-carrier-protein] synthase II
MLPDLNFAGVSDMRRRVVITGMGVVTPLGHSVAEMFRQLCEGASGIDRITHFDASRFPTTFAAEVKQFDLEKWIKNSARYSACGSNTIFALAAAQQALADANLLKVGEERSRFGVYLGSGEGGEDFRAVVYGSAVGAAPNVPKVDGSKYIAAVRPILRAAQEAEMEMNTSAAHVADEFELLGPNFACLTACAASAQAIGEAAEMIRLGDADLMLAGGSHSMIHPFGVTGFNRLTALSTRNHDPKKASRPFDLNRDGFVLGEGAGILILEDLEHAKARGATIYAELSGYGTTGDAFRMTDPHPQGRGAVKAMQMAMKDAQLSPEDIGYINAHGTSTPANDSAETAGIKTALGEAARRIPVSSSKSMLGHLIAAGGAVELIISILAMHQDVIPPTINYETPDPECDLDYVPNQARPVKGVRHVLSNSFGFGGQNITLIASRV